MPKKLYLTLGLIAGLIIGGVSLVHAYPITPSAGVGTNPVAGSVLLTNGVTSTWVATSSLGISGGGGGSGSLASTTPWTVGNLVVVSGTQYLASISSGTYYLATNPAGYITSSIPFTGVSTTALYRVLARQDRR